jgi:hypothetical protein
MARQWLAHKPKRWGKGVSDGKGWEGVTTIATKEGAQETQHTHKCAHPRLHAKPPGCTDRKPAAGTYVGADTHSCLMKTPGLGPAGSSAAAGALNAAVAQAAAAVPPAAAAAAAGAAAAAAAGAAAAASRHAAAILVAA